MYLIRQTPQFAEWLLDLKDRQAVIKIHARIEMIEAGSLGDHKSVSDGVSEIRINSGPGYRLFYTLRQKVVVILLAGGNKSSQKRDINLAKKLASNLK